MLNRSLQSVRNSPKSVTRLRKRLSEYAMDKMAELDKEMGL